MSNYIPLGIRKILSKTGWTDNEVGVYSVLLEKGAMDLTTISHETGVSLSTLQYSVKQLLAKKMLSKSLINNKPFYSVSNVEQLKKWMKGFVKQFKDYGDSVNQFVDQYDFNPKVFTSKVKFYEGYKGVKQSYRDMLKECDDGEIVAFFSVVEEIGKDLQDFFVEEYVKERVKKNIKIKNIALESPKALTYKQNDSKELRQTKLISNKFFPAINTEINLYGDFMHCMSFDEKGAFALIIEDHQLVAIIRAIFGLLWQKAEGLYMFSDLDYLKNNIEKRKHLYTNDLKKKWKSSKPEILKTNEGETIMNILGHEVMSTYQLPYMQKLADVVTQNGGDILNVGYGLGIIDGEIEKYRESRSINNHYVIENNKYIAAEAKKLKNLIVIENDWHEVIDSFRGEQFDGIIYDAYPLSIEELHRDGVIFIEKVVSRNLLKKNGVLTFYVDASHDLGVEFKTYLCNLGFNYIKIEKIKVIPPNRERQIYFEDHFLAPILKYNK